MSRPHPPRQDRTRMKARTIAGALYEHDTYETPEEAAPRIRAAASMANMHGQTDRLSQRNLPGLYGEKTKSPGEMSGAYAGQKWRISSLFPKSETKRIFGVCP